MGKYKFFGKVKSIHIVSSWIRNETKYINAIRRNQRSSRLLEKITNGAAFLARADKSRLTSAIGSRVKIYFSQAVLSTRSLGPRC
jgi:hypothetical protein